MKTLKKAPLILTLVFLTYSSYAESNLDIMLVFSDDISLSTFEKTVVAARYQAVLSDVYGLSGVPFTGQLDGVRSVEVWPLTDPEMSVTASTKSNAEVLQWLIDENAKLLPVPSPLRSARELLGNPGADIILMVVPS